MSGLLKSQGVMLILSSPSGAGKTTISNLLVAREPRLVRSISVTTRRPRPYEVDGRDYFFVDEEEFYRFCKAGKMLEHAKVFSNCYGVPKSFVEDNINNGTSVLFSIDWQGTFNLMSKMRSYIVSVFILPPSMTELESRLRSRGDESSEIIRDRLNQASFEASHCSEYDYVIINEDLETSVRSIQGILAAERLKISRCEGLEDFLGDMFSERKSLT